MDFKEELKELLLTLPRAKLTHGGKQVLIKCQECGDSLNPTHGHLSINLGYDSSPLYFQCFKCHYSGLLNIDTLISWGVYSANPNLLSEMSIYNKKSLTLEKNKKFKDSLVYKLNNHYISNNKLSELKLKYINNRLGTDLNYDDILSKKIVLNLKDLLFYSNKIETITRSEDIINQLNNYFVGFISEDNAFLNLRCILKPDKMNILDESIRRRYTQYSIFNKFDTTRNNYTIPTAIDLLNQNRVKINISEGSFDLLSIFYNLRNGDSNNCIYSSISGNNYASLCAYFIARIGIMNPEFHIYIDNDIDRYSVKNVERICRDFQAPLFIHNNNKDGEKDFGVTINRIEEQIIQLV